MRLRRTLVPVASFVVLAVVVAVVPSFVSEFRAQQLAYVGIYLTAIIGLNVLTGLSGQVSLGHGAFMAVGGYVTAVLVSDQGLKLFGHTFSSSVRDIWTLPLAGLLAGIAGLLVGLPATRLAGAYLALATFGIGVALPAILLMEILGAMIATFAMYEAGESIKPWQPRRASGVLGEARG